MKKLVLVMALIALNGSAMAVVDWTPYLKTMQDSCTKPNIEQIFGLVETTDEYGGTDYVLKQSKIPKELKASIYKFNESSPHYIDVQLKNAVAFGHPIKSIAYIEEAGYSFTVYFANNNFTQAKANFFFTVNGKKHPVGIHKYWHVTRHYDEQTDTSTSTYKSINKTQYLKYDKQIEKGDNNNLNIANIDNNGWYEGGYYSGRGLSFDTKEKSIKCFMWAE